MLGEHRMKTGEILVVKDDKLLILSDNHYFIIKGKGSAASTVEFDPEQALPMPSYLFAIAAIEDENLDNTMQFIKSQWFKD